MMNVWLDALISETIGSIFFLILYNNYWLMTISRKWENCHVQIYKQISRYLIILLNTNACWCHYDAIKIILISLSYYNTFLVFLFMIIVWKFKHITSFNLISMDQM